MTQQRRTYTGAEHAEAVALAAAVGPRKAAAELGIPRRTVSYWLHKPAASLIIAEAERDIAARLREAHSEALAAVLAGLSDPKARLGDRARALEVLGEQLALAEGRATSHNLNINGTADPTAGLTEAERGDLRQTLDAALAGQSMAELAAGRIPDREMIIGIIGVIERELAQRNGR